jgi:hypothetical protein
MKNLEIIYENGHFYDLHTEQRIELADKAKVWIAGDDENFIINLPPAGNQVADKKAEHAKIVLDLDKAKSEGREHPIYSDFKSVLLEGKKIYFMAKQHRFEVELLEPLFAFRKNGSTKFNLCDCACKSISELDNKLSFFEPVYGKSLNDVYKCTYVHYFGNKGNPAKNAIDGFFCGIACHKNDVLRKIVET